MTCIVAVKQDGKVWLGADSAGCDSSFYKVLRKDPKIYTVGKFTFGFTSSFRMGQLLGYSLRLPERTTDSLETYIYRDVIKAIRQCLGEGGFTNISNNNETGGTFIMVYENRIFTVECDFQVGESLDNYTSVGCGSPYALGSLHTNRDYGFNAKTLINKALEAAEHFSAGVAGPFNIVECE